MVNASRVLSSPHSAVATRTDLDGENCFTAIRKRFSTACLIGSEDRSCLAMPSIRKNANAGGKRKEDKYWPVYSDRELTKHSAGKHQRVVEDAFSRKLFQDICHYLLHQRAEGSHICGTAVERNGPQRWTFGKGRSGMWCATQRD